ncbi:MAG: hypothetical protein OHK0045_12710 [Raineya sp.]
MFAQATNKEIQAFSELYQKMTQEAQNKNYAQAATFGEQAEPLAEKVLGKEQEKLGSFYYNLGNFQAAASNASKAEISYKKCIEIRKKTLGTTHPDYIKSVDKLANLYAATGKQTEADKLLAQLKKDQKNNQQPENLQGQNSPEFAKTLTNQALGQIKSGKEKEAEKNLIQAINIYQKNNIKTTDYATAADAYGIVLAQKGKIKEAIPFFESAYEIRKTQLGEMHIQSQETAYNLAVCYDETRQPAKALKMLENVVQAQEKNNLQNTSKYTEALSFLGRLYVNNKDVVSGEKVLKKALENEQKNPQSSPQYAQILNDLARLEFLKGNSHFAENYQRIALENMEKAKGKKSTDYAAALVNLANLLKLQGKNKEAEKNYQQAENTLKTLKQEKSPLALQIRAYLADLYASEKRYEQAIKLYEQVLPQQKEILGEENSAYWTSLANLADCYTSLKQYKKAKPLYETLINIPTASNSNLFPRWLINLGGFYYETGAYQEAETFFETALQTYQEKLVGQEAPYIEALENLANLYKNQGRYFEAEKIYKQAREVCKKTFGEKHFVYTNLQNDLANLYKSLGRFEEAEKIYKQNLLLLSEQGEETLQYAQILNDIAVLYRDAGKFAETEPLLSKSLAIRKKLLGDKSAEYAESLQNIASLHKLMGRYQEALGEYQKALAIRKEVLGETHPDYATTLNALANLYKKTNNLDQAEPLYLEALSIRKATFGEENPEYAFSLDNIANFYQNTHQYQKAESSYKQALAIRKKVYGNQHPIYAGSLNNLAVLYEKNKQLSQAEQLYQEALSIFKATLGNKHPHYIATLNNLAMVYEAQQKYEQATPLFRELAKNTLEQIKRNFSTLSENEKREFFISNKPFLDNFILFAANSYFRKSKEYVSLLEEAYQLLIATKGIILNSTGKARQEILNSKDSKLIASYEEWVKLREMIAKLYNTGNAELKALNINIDSLENKTMALEKELSAKSKIFDEVFNTKLFSWKDIQAKLKDQEVLLEITRIQVEQGRVFYLIFIIKKNTKTTPEVLIINNGAELEEALAFYKNSIKFRKEDKESYQVYWKPFEPFLSDTKKVFLSVDGVFTQINPSTLFNVTNQKYVLEQWQVALITSSKDLLQSKNNTSLTGKALLVGNPIYQIQGTANADKIDLDNQDSFWLRNSTFASLPATQIEVESIEKTLQNIKTLQIKKLLGKDATEANLKNEIAQAQLLHIATHGFFVPSKYDEDSKSKTIYLGKDKGEEQDDPMLRSGLVFAGVTDYFRSEKRNQNEEDGILTAYEVMNQQLDKAALVVLSACETGLGKVQAGEGVYGLQRAFRIAGTQSLMMSLWKVDDVATQELMQNFYEEWTKSNNKAEALIKAQNKLKEKYKHPYYWGAFVLIGE